MLALIKAVYLLVRYDDVEMEHDEQLLMKQCKQYIFLTIVSNLYRGTK